MSIDLNWETLTTGPDGERLALQIRDFIHQKFQAVPLPRFLKSVTVHGFEFGSVPPELELKDITDPLPDFYEVEGGEEDSEDDGEAEEELARSVELRRREKARDERTERQGQGRDGKEGFPPRLHTGAFGRHGHHQDASSPFLGIGTPGIMGGSNLHYFQSHIGGSQTPLAAVAGAHLGNGWQSSMASSSARQPAYPTPSHSRNPSQSSIITDDFNLQPPPAPLREKSSVSTLAPTSAGASRPPTRDTSSMTETAIEEESDNNDDDDQDKDPPSARQNFPEPRVEDLQAVFRIRYAGDVRLMLTAEILLDYPMPSFVGIPVKLNITGLTFDGVGVLAHIRKRVHFCFLSPEDAVMAVGATGTDTGSAGTASSRRSSAAGGEDFDGRKGGMKFGGLLQEIKVESEIGHRDAGKQSLKNVGKVEKFVLEQVRRIFEEEFVYPSFWTFLV